MKNVNAAIVSNAFTHRLQEYPTKNTGYYIKNPTLTGNETLSQDRTIINKLTNELRYHSTFK